MADGATMKQAEKLFTEHARKLNGGQNLIKDHVGDTRDLCAPDSND